MRMERELRRNMVRRWVREAELQRTDGRYGSNERMASDEEDDGNSRLVVDRGYTL